MNRLRYIWDRLHASCAARDWQGADPYDGLTSPLARFLPGKVARQAWTQWHRRSPVNLRRLCGIRPLENAKALALFALGNPAAGLLDRLESLQTADGGWGYPFGWQSRAFYAPPATPNLICTAFAIRALRAGGRAATTKFIEDHLVNDRHGERWIGYIPGSATQVHNVNLIGAALLQRRDCLEFSIQRQRADGSWWYGEAPNQHWIDNFHSGYNLVALRDYARETGDHDFDEAAQRGLAYWKRTFWEPDGGPRYFHDRRWPVDIHCCAQGILTHLAYDEPAAAGRVAKWTIENMWAEETGFFWYQQGRYWNNRICYMRWAQAWMYYALAELIKANETTNH